MERFSLSGMSQRGDKETGSREKSTVSAKKRTSRLLTALAIFAWTLVLVPIRWEASSFTSYTSEYAHIFREVCGRDLELAHRHIVYFRQLPDDIAGFCIERPGVKRIEIDPGVWLDMNDDVRRWLIFHELSHCYLDLDHSDRGDNYMSPYVFEMEHSELVRQVRVDMRKHCGVL